MTASEPFVRSGLMVPVPRLIDSEKTATILTSGATPVAPLAGVTLINVGGVVSAARPPESSAAVLMTSLN